MLHHPTKQLLYRHVPPISQTIQGKYAGLCWGIKYEFTNDVYLWTPIYGHTSVGRSEKTYIYQFCADTGCHHHDLSGAILHGDWR